MENDNSRNKLQIKNKNIKIKLKTFDWIFLFIVSVLFLIISLILSYYGVSTFRPESYISNAVLYIFSWFILEIPFFLYSLFDLRPESPLNFTSSYVKRKWKKYNSSIPSILALILFMPLFSTVKASIPLFTDYTWDADFIKWDRAIFGDDTWRVIHPVFGFPLITSALSVAYHAWILLIYVGSIFFAVYYRRLCQRYFLSFLMIWTVGGMAMAIGLASVGPVFAEPLLGDRTFAPQMAYLRSANQQWPVLVLDVQETLLEWHRTGQFGLGRGITAMPSMHVALAMLFWLAMRHVSKAAGWVFGLFYIVIFVGSVHLAYHYAVDGIISSILAVTAWVISGLISRRCSGYGGLPPQN